jgi:cysteine desulfurase
LIYLDHNASTPVRPEVVAAMRSALADVHANPSSLHREGQAARAAVERARAQVASLVNARAAEVAFVSGGTEGDHLGLIGSAWASTARGRRVAISAIEHHAVHGAAESLAEQGFAVETLAVGSDGVVDPGAIDRLPAEVTVVAVMLANNETGVLQPVAEIARRAHARGMRVLCDAVQAAGKVAIDAAALDADYLVVSGHKLGGPKGCGALVVRGAAPLTPLFRGSAQEGGRRAGTENLPGIVGLGLACELAAGDLAGESRRIHELRERLEGGLRAIDSSAVLHGGTAPRLPNTVMVSFAGARSDHLLMALDARGVAVSAGAACASGAVEPSPVLAAMGVPRAQAECAVRLSLGRTTTAADLDAALAAMGDAVHAARGVQAARR